MKKNPFNINALGQLMPVKQLVSPNCNERPENTVISLLVIHNISLPPAEFGSQDVEDFFLNQLSINKHPYFTSIKDFKVSSHLFIRRDGEVIQFVPFTQRAWHAGESSFKGVSHCNDYSIGIELEGCDDQVFTVEQYEVLAQVTPAIMQQYPAITLDRIVGHSDIAPGRKTDPGPCFDWEKFFHGISES